MWNEYRPSHPAPRRAQWLAELSEALEQAHNLMWKLGIGDGGGPAAMELYLRIEAARLEVQALRLGRRYQKAQEIDPERTEPLAMETQRHRRLLNALRQVAAARKMARETARAAAASSRTSRRTPG